MNHFMTPGDDWLNRFSEYSVQLMPNLLSNRSSVYSEALRLVLDYSSCQETIATIQTWANYQPTVLRSLEKLSDRLGIEQIWLKDESTRFGLGSFKALGGAYAVYRQLAQRLQQQTGIAAISASTLQSGLYREFLSQVTVTTATDGNHGRSVAWGARQLGCQCVIYLHENVSSDRAEKIASEGAKIVRVSGNYDDSVRCAAADATQHNWLLIADTSYPGYVEVPRDVMRGYTVMVEEALQQIALQQISSRPSHVFVQAGVGSLAAAVAGYLWQVWSDDRPVFIVVEPEQAACLYESNRQERLTELSGDIETFMSCLSAGLPSLEAWQILHQTADFFLTIPDAAAKTCMRLLAKGTGESSPIVSGESGCAGFAAFLSAWMQPAIKHQLQLNERSRVLLFNTEGATDLTVYQTIVEHSS
jgi:diaminopropionate ammonia-lyase